MGSRASLRHLGVFSSQPPPRPLKSSKAQPQYSNILRRRRRPPSTSKPRDDHLPLVAPALPLTTSTHHPPPKVLQGPRLSPAIAIALSAPRSHSSRQGPTESPRTQALARHLAAHVRWAPIFTRSVTRLGLLRSSPASRSVCAHPPVYSLASA